MKVPPARSFRPVRSVKWHTARAGGQSLAGCGNGLISTVMLTSDFVRPKAAGQEELHKRRSSRLHYAESMASAYRVLGRDGISPTTVAVVGPPSLLLKASSKRPLRSAEDIPADERAGQF